MCTSTDVLRPIAAERVHYFSRQLITADDMMAEQDYFRQKLRRHNRYLHGWGVVCGCAVVPPPVHVVGHPWQVLVCPGYIITPQGDEILIAETVSFDLAGDSRQLPDPCANPSPCPPPMKSGTGGNEGQNVVYLAACYTECQTRPVRLHPTGCSCDDSACDYSRIRDSFELMVLQTLPVTQRVFGPTGPACPKCLGDSCVVLATITLPTRQVAGNKSVPALDVPISLADISYADRTLLYSVAELPQPPTILSTFPANEETNIFSGAVIRATFSRSMDAKTIASPANTITVDGVTGTVSYDSTSNNAFYTPPVNFSPGIHTVKISAQVKDTYGTPLIGDYSWSFSVP
jgi:hypothetical protein